MNHTNGAGGGDFSLFPWRKYIPHILTSNLFFWINVIGDGNYEYRVVIITELGGEEAWPLLLRVMFMEMQVHRPQYLHLYLSSELLDEAMFRIGSHNKGLAPFIHWSDASLRLYSITTFLNISIAYYGSSDGNPEYNFLVFPLRRTQGEHGVNKVVDICYVNGNRYIQLLMNHDLSPPPLVYKAWRQAVDNSYRHMERHFCSKINLLRKNNIMMQSI